MIMPKQDERKNSRRDLESKIIAHAWKDRRFREHLLADPKSALKELDCPVPEKLQIIVIEEQENQWVLVLPKAPVDVAKLSNAELNSAAGGGAYAGNSALAGSDSAVCGIDSSGAAPESLKRLFG